MRLIKSKYRKEKLQKNAPQSVADSVPNEDDPAESEEERETEPVRPQTNKLLGKNINKHSRRDIPLE